MQTKRTRPRVSLMLLALGILLVSPFAVAADGNVKVSINGANITLKGDGEDNDVQIFNTGGIIEVRGINSTTVDVPMTGVDATNVGKLTVKLKGGDDFFQINAGVTINGKLRISTSSGNDDLDVFAGTFNRKATISSGSGDDTISVDTATFNEKVNIKAGGGNDQLAFGIFVPKDCMVPEFNDKLKVKMGSGDDLLTVECDALNDKPATLSGGRGTDDVTPDPATLEAQGVKVKKFEQ